MRAYVHHGLNKDCPTVAEGKASHCPGHEVEVTDEGEGLAQRAGAEAYGRGYRRCFEDLTGNPSVHVLLACREYEYIKPLLRGRLEKHMGADAVRGWDSIDGDKKSDAKI
jgi:hypothetical protein